MLERGLTQTDVARLMGAHTSNISRIMSGKIGLSPNNRAVLARILACPEAAFLDALGEPVPAPPAVACVDADMPDFNRRLQAVVTVLGPERIEAYLRFLASGNFGALPADVVRQLRDILEPT